MIRTIVIGVPAQNEASRIGSCVASLLAAADELDPTIDVHIVVAADSCVDETASIVDGFNAAVRRVHLIDGTWGTAGGTRRAAIATGLALATRTSAMEADLPLDLPHDMAAEEVWIATTDADTVVPADWLRRQLVYAQHGFDAVAGIVDLIHDEDVTSHIVERFAELYRFGDHVSHAHVHGANLGVRASAYLAAGGFPDVVCSEDHALWNNLRGLGFACVSPIDVRVLTSARVRSRAPGGFADTLAAFVAARGNCPPAERAVA